MAHTIGFLDEGGVVGGAQMFQDILMPSDPDVEWSFWVLPDRSCATCIGAQGFFSASISGPNGLTWRFSFSNNPSQPITLDPSLGTLTPWPYSLGGYLVQSVNLRDFGFLPGDPLEVGYFSSANYSNRSTAFIAAAYVDDVAPAPEPGTLVLMATGVAVMAAGRRRLWRRRGQLR